MYLFGHLYTRWDHLSYLVEDALFYLFIFDGVVEDALNHKNKACVFIKKKMLLLNSILSKILV